MATDLSPKGQAALLYEQTVEKLLSLWEFRNYVIETVSIFLDESEEAFELVSSKYKDRKTKKNLRTFYYRIIMMTLLTLSMVLDVFGLIFVGRISKAFLYDLRLLFILIALVTTVISFAVFARKGDIKYFALSVVFGLIFECSMLSLFKNGRILLIFGIAAISVRVIIMTFITIYRQYETEFSERLYLKYMDNAWYRNISKLIMRVIDICGVADDELTYPEASVKVMKGITEAMDEYSNINQSESNHSSIHHSSNNDTITVLDPDMPNLQADVIIVNKNSDNARSMRGEMFDVPSRMHPLLISSVRNAILQEDTRMTRIVLFILLFVICVTAGTVVFEFWKMFAKQSPTFSDNLNEKYNNRDRILAEFGGNRSHVGLKVHLVVIDGLRDDFTDPGTSALGDYMDTPDFKRLSMKFHTRAQLPSFSVPNWVSILTGAFPEDTGVIGNFRNKETTFDNIYAIAKEFNVHAGMTGTTWWADLVASTLPHLGGDGTVDPDYKPSGTPAYGWTTSDPADQVRKEVALSAVRRNKVSNPFGTADVMNFYELFLTHFSDVDAQGHVYGVHMKHNKRDTYRGAVANKTKAIQEIVDAIDNQTVLIITSDHGHVMRGGHGGADDILRDIPLVFYKKGDSFEKPDANFFTETEEPLSRFNGKYSNLDLSATICAILGLPSPRQSMGVFVEEAVETFIPPGVQLRHYHDLFIAKVRVVQQYHEMMEESFFPGMTPNIFVDIDDRLLNRVLKGDSAFSQFNSDPHVTKASYTNLIKKIIPEYQKLRQVRNDGLLIRNFVASLLVFVSLVVVIGFIYHKATFLRISALIDRSHPLNRINLITFLCAFGTLLLYLLLSLVTYIVIYYAIIGQTLWDSTATHAEAVLAQYVVAVIVGPVIYFIIITKALLIRTIRWRMSDAVTEMRSLKRIRPSHIVRWLFAYFIADVQSLILATRNYKPHQYLWAHLYIHYLSGWTILSSLVMLFMCFPFSFILPGIYSVSHVSEFILIYRFRLLSVLFMMLPIQCGCILMVYLRPSVVTENRTLWDMTIVKSRLVGDLYCVESRRNNMMPKEKLFGDGDESNKIVNSYEEKIISLKESEKNIRLLAQWLCDPRLTSYIYDSKRDGSILLEFCRTDCI